MLGKSILSYLPVNLANMLTAFGRLGLCTSIGAFALIMTVLNLGFIDPALTYVLIFALGSGCIQVFFNLGMEAHRAAHRIKQYSLTYSAQTLVSFTLGILFVIYTPLKAAAPFAGIAAGLVIVGSLDLFFMWRRMRGGSFHSDKAKTYFIYGAPLCIGLLLSYALNSADAYIIKFFMGSASVGEYNAGYNLANRSLEILFVWVSMAVTPVAVTAMEREGMEKSQEILKNYGATLLWIAVPAATGIALVAKDAGFILGEGVRENAVMVMPWIALAGLINGCMTYYVHRAFMLSGQTHKFVWALVAPVILNIGLNFILIPTHGLMGAVWATILSYTLALIIATILGRRDYPLPLPIRAAAEIAFCSAVMAGAVYLLPLSSFTPGFLTLVLKGGVGVAVYLIACWIINAADCRTVIKGLRNRMASPQSPLPEPAE